MADIELVITMPEDSYKATCSGSMLPPDVENVVNAIKHGVPLPEGHGRIGDLDELEQRISNFVEHDAKITDEYTVVRQRFIVDGIRQTPTIIEADKAESEEEGEE